MDSLIFSIWVILFSFIFSMFHVVFLEVSLQFVHAVVPLVNARKMQLIVNFPIGSIYRSFELLYIKFYNKAWSLFHTFFFIKTCCHLFSLGFCCSCMNEKKTVLVFNVQGTKCILVVFNHHKQLA